MRKLRILTSAAALLVSLAFAGSALAAAINGDFDDTVVHNYVGTAAAPDSGTVWNSLLVGTGTSAALLDSTGAATTVTVTTTSLNNPVNNNSYSGMPAVDLLRDYVYNSVGAGTGNITFNNVPAGIYDLYLYNVNGFNQSSGAKFNFGSNKTVTNDGSSPIGFVDGVNYVKFAGLLPVSGQISGTIVATNASQSAFNGFQLVQVPEPASIGLVALGGLVLIIRQRRA